MITFDYTRLQEAAVGPNGISDEQLSHFKPNLEEKYQHIQSQEQAGQLGFTKLPYQDVAEITALADELRQEFSTFVVVGIGGSDLGARAVHRALNHQFYNLRSTPQLFFFGDTTDPVVIQEVFDVIDLPKTAFIVISKSGNTVEQMSTFVWILHELNTKLGSGQAARHIVILTDHEKGTLRELVQEKGYRSLSVPDDVGGRFSVLSSVGLLPLALAGIDINHLLQGAAELNRYDTETTPENGNMMALYAGLQIWNYQQNRPISVLMAYSYSLREFGFWFRQLWAESLGKKNDLAGTVVNVGPTPIAALGPTDQHSQVQLYMEGPADKVFTFIGVETLSTNMTLPETFPEHETINYLRGHSFQEILHAELQSTMHALATEGRPSCLLTIPMLDAYHLGQLLYFFELAVTYAGALLNINTFDQPGVEIGKNYMYGLLGRPGYEEWHIK